MANLPRSQNGQAQTRGMRKTAARARWDEKKEQARIREEATRARREKKKADKARKAGNLAQTGDPQADGEQDGDVGQENNT